MHELSAQTYLAASPKPASWSSRCSTRPQCSRRPSSFLQRNDFSHEQKAAILRRWAYDARELEVAEDEGMRDGERDLLDRVLRALDALKARSTSG